jgi:hypothetical protein
MNDAEFNDSLAKSDVVVRLVGKWAEARGHKVWLLPLKVRVPGDRLEDVQDNGDLLIDDQRSEAKGLGINFTGLSDWPYREFFAMECKPWDRADPKPTWIIAVSADLTHIGMVAGKTSGCWQRRYHIWDSRQGKYCDFMAAPLRVVRWYRIADDLR